jgi:hypothetical protein
MPLLALLLACAAPASPQPPAPEAAPKEVPVPAALDSEALALLGDASTWCDGAARLARAGSTEAVLPLLAAYESRTEASKACLLDAIEALGGGAYAHALATDDDAGRRRAAAHLMELMADGSHLEVLARLAADSDAKVREQAAWALRTQVQTDDWERTCVELLGADDPKVRSLMVQAVARREGDAVRQALAARAAVETDASVRRQLDKALGR